MKQRLSREELAQMIASVQLVGDDDALVDIPDRLLQIRSGDRPYQGDTTELPERIEMFSRDCFGFEGQVYKLSETQWFILDEIVRGGGTATFANIGEQIWGNDNADSKYIVDGIKKLRRRLQEYRLPFVIRHRREKAFFAAS